MTIRNIKSPVKELLYFTNYNYDFSYYYVPSYYY